MPNAPKNTRTEKSPSKKLAPTKAASSKLLPTAHLILATQLRQARKRKGMTQVELASRLGTSQTIVSFVERGLQAVDVVRLQRWLTILDVPMLLFMKNFDDLVRAQTAATEAWSSETDKDARSSRT